MSESTEKRHYDFDLRLDDEVSTHAVQFRLIPDGSRVLEVGCHTGIMGEALRRKKHCSVVGIDVDQDALSVASERLDSTMRVDLEREGWSSAVLEAHPSGFDLILFGDVLEHTREPQSIITEAKRLLAPEGRVIVSVPNVANLRVRLQILRGNFDYQDAGILDRGHLRFFTRASAMRMLLEAGYAIEKVTFSGYSLPRWLIDRFPTLLAVNVIIVAHPDRSLDRVDLITS